MEMLAAIGAGKTNDRCRATSIFAGCGLGVGLVAYRVMGAWVVAQYCVQYTQMHCSTLP